MKKRFLKISSALIAVMLTLAALASCGSRDAETNKNIDDSAQTSTDNTNTDASETTPPNVEPTVSVVTTRYGISNGQWGQFSKYVYNERGQLTSVTAISPFTLAPLCYETIKFDRVYVYGDDGMLDRVWLNHGVVLNITYSADGLAAEGSGTKDGDTYNVKLTFSDKKILLKEEYTWPEDSLVNEYDSDGNIIKITQGTGFVTTHTYSEGKVNMSLCKADGTKMTDYSFALDGTRLVEVSAQGESIKLTYENGLCTKGDYNGQTYTMEYDSKGRVISTNTGGEFDVTETFEYDSDSRISKYTRERKTALSGRWEHEVVTCVYTYAQDGTISKFAYQLVEYDNLGKETYRREEQY